MPQLAARAMIFLILSVGLAYAQDLCKSNETMVFGFRTEKNKNVSLCVAKDSRYIVYRFGTEKKIDFEFPGSMTGSWAKFKRYSYHRGGGAANAGLDIDNLIFTNGDYEYTLYQEYTAENDKEIVGIRVKNLKTKKTVEINGDMKTKMGGLSPLRSEERIKEIE